MNTPILTYSPAYRLDITRRSLSYAGTPA
ncbi:hypothetical protein BLAT2472_10054 [Burkholderia latens]